MIDQDKREFGGWWMWILGLIVVAVVVFGALRVVGVNVERAVFTSSYQRDASYSERIATFRAQISEIDAKLANPDLDDTTRNNLSAQRSAINIQLQAAEAAR